MDYNQSRQSCIHRSFFFYLYNNFLKSLSAFFFTTPTGSFIRNNVISRLQSKLAQLHYWSNYLGSFIWCGAATNAHKAGLTNAKIQV